MTNNEIIDSLPNESIKVLEDFSDADWIKTTSYSESKLKPLFEHGLIQTEIDFISLTLDGHVFCSDWVWDD